MVATLLKDHVGQYVDVDVDKVAVSIWDGKVELEDLNLRPDAFKALNLPVKIISGCVSKLTLHIPWSSLGTEAVVLTVEDIFCTVEPTANYTGQTDKETLGIKQTELEAKRTKLESIATETAADIERVKIGGNVDDEKTSSFLERLITKVVNNLQVKIKNLHIQLQDHQEISEHGFAFGVVLKSLNIVSTNERWETVFVEGDKSKGEIYKILELSQFGVYFACGDPASHEKDFFDTIFDEKMVTDHPYYILRPISLVQKLKVDNRSNVLTLGGPKFTADLDIQQIVFALTRAQYSSFIDMLDRLDKFLVSRKYLQYKNQVSVITDGSISRRSSVIEDPKGWWAFAYNAVLHDFRMERGEKKRKMWVMLKRNKYVKLYKSTLVAATTSTVCQIKPIKPAEQEEMNRLEDDHRMTIDDILHLRRMAEAELLLVLKHFGNLEYNETTVKERISTGKRESSSSFFRETPNASRKTVEKKTTRKKQSLSVWGRMKQFTGFGQSEVEGQDDAQNSGGSADELISVSVHGQKLLEINDDIRKTVFDRIGFDPNEKTEEYPPLFLITKFCFVIQHFGIHLYEKERKPLLLVDMWSSNFEMDYRQGNRADIGSPEPNIIIHTHVTNLQAFDCMGEIDEYRLIFTKRSKLHSDNIFEASFELNPVSQGQEKAVANSILMMKLMPQEIVVSSKMINRISKFFVLEARDLSNMVELAANAASSSLQKRKEAIEALVASRYKLQLRVELNVPTIKILGDIDVTTKRLTEILCLDFGQFLLKSDDDKCKIDGANKDQRYDHFAVNADNFKAVIVDFGPPRDDAQRSFELPILNTEDQMSVQIGFCRLPPDIAKMETLSQGFFVVSLPRIRLFSSHTVLKKLMSIFRTFDNGVPSVPKIEGANDNHESVKTYEAQEMQRLKPSSPYVNFNVNICLKFLEFNWQDEKGDLENRKFQRIFSMSLSEFDANICLLTDTTKLVLKFHDISMMQHIVLSDNSEIDFHIVRLEQMLDEKGSSDTMLSTGVPFCDLVMPVTNAEVPTQAKIAVGFIKIDCDASRLFKLMEVYEAIIDSIDVETPEFDIPDISNVDPVVGGTKVHLKIGKFLCNLSGHENGRERPFIKTNIHDFEFSFFSYDDGMKFLLRAAISMEHFDTHAIVWQPAIEPTVLHVDGRCPQPTSMDQNIHFDVRSESDIVLNATVGLIHDVGIVAGELTTLIESKSSLENSETFSPYILHNRTGSPLQIWFPRSDEFPPSSKEDIDICGVHQFSLPADRQAKADFLGLGQQRSRINVAIKGFQLLKDMSLDTIGTQFYIVYPEDGSSMEHLLQWEVSLNAGARDIVISSALCVRNNTPWDMDIHSSSSNLFDTSYGEPSTLLSGSSYYAPIAIAHSCRLDVKLAEKEIEWGVVDADSDASFHGINAPMETFAKNENFAVVFFRAGVPVYGVALNVSLGEHSDLFHHASLELSPAVRICNNLAQKLTLVLHDRNTNEPTQMNTILPGEELCPYVLRRGISLPSKHSVEGRQAWHPLVHLLKATHVQFILNEFKDSSCIPLIYPDGKKVRSGEKAKHTMQLLDETENDSNIQIHYFLEKKTSCSLAIEISCAFWLINQSGLPLIFSKPCERVKDEIEIAPGQCFPVVEEVYENQRYYMLAGWSNKLLPGERFCWSDKAGICKTLKHRESIKLPNKDTWVWQNEWTIDMSFGDSDGWSYASVNFKNEPYKTASFTGAVVRRRRWIRTRKPTKFHSNLKSVCMYGPSAKVKTSLFRMRVWDSSWSPPIDLLAVGTKGMVTVAERDGKVEYQFIISISIPPTIRLRETKLVTIVSRFVIVNNTRSEFQLLLGQCDRRNLYKKFFRKSKHLKFEEQKPFHWTDATEPKEVSVMIRHIDEGVDKAFEDNEKMWSEPFKIEEVGLYAVKFCEENVLTKENKDLRVEIKATETSIAIVFSVVSVDLSPNEVLSQRLSRVDSEDLNVGSELRMAIVFSQIQLSIFDAHRTEVALLKISQSEFFLSTNLSGNITTLSLELKVGEVEIDNMTPAPYFPVVFRSRTAHAPDLPPFLHITLVKENRLEDESDIVYIPYFMFALQTVDVRTDERFIARLMDVLEALTEKRTSVLIEDLLSSFATAEDSERSIQAAIGLATVPKKMFVAETMEVDQVAASKRLCFEVFQINPLHINLSFKRVGDSKRSSRFDSVKSILMDLNQCSLKFDGMVITKSIGPMQRLTARIVEYYKHAMIGQLYKVLGSISVLGKPVGLVGSLGSGVKTFFVEPALAVRKGPKDFARGVRKGTFGLLSNIGEGIGTAAGALAGTIGDGVASMAFDEEFLAARQRRDQAVAEGGFKNGLFYGAQAFGSSLASGIGGLARAPIKGAKEGGLSGFVAGVGKGIVGVPTKVISGAFEAVSHVSEGAANSAVNQREGAGTVRKRAERFIRSRHRRLLQGPERALVIWQPMEERIIETIERLGVRSGDADEIDRNKQETFLYYLILGSASAIFLTTKKIYFIQESALLEPEPYGRQSNHMPETTLILWQKTLFPDSRFVVISSIVSIFSRLYEVVGSNLDQINTSDKHIFSRMVIMKDATQDEDPFNVPKTLQISGWEKELDLVRQISYRRHPKENMETLSDILESINIQFQEKTEAGLGGADELLPIISYIACKSMIRRPMLCMKLIKVLCDEEMQGVGGYATATFESCFETFVATVSS